MGKRDPPPTGGKHAGSSSSSSSGAVAKDPKRAHLSAKQQRKKGGNEYKKNWAAFNEQLRAYGLVLRTIGGDGNCLFRSLADQLCGRQDDHQRYRTEIVAYMCAHPLDFAPFVWDSTFEQYLAKMGKSGEWGGAAELAAAAKCYGINITVHQYAAPRLENRYDPASVTWDPDNKDVAPPLPLTKDTRTIHLSYHDESHYSSVRNISDQHSFEPATPIVLSDAAAAAASSSSSSSSSSAALSQAETIVLQSSGCKNLSKIRALLKESWNDANAVVEMLVAEQTMGLDINVDHEAAAAEQQKEIEQQRKDEENKAAAARLRAKEQQQREEAHLAQQMALLELTLATERQEQQQQASKRESESAAGFEECKGEPASDDHAEPEDTVTADEHAHSEGDDAADDAADDADAASSSSGLAPSSAASAAASSSSSACASVPRPARPKVHHAGRDKRVAAKHAKMLMDKAKRANKSTARKEKADMGAAIASAEVSTAANKLGAVRI